LEKLAWVTYREVTQKKRPDKKVYRVTKKGQAELVRWIEDESEIPVSKDELLIKLYVGHLVPSDVLIGQLERRRAAHLSRYKAYKVIEGQQFGSPKGLPLAQKYQYLTLRRGLTYEKGWLSWFNEAIRLLESHRQKAG
jgi:hypothetical protein